MRVTKGRVLAGRDAFRQEEYQCREGGGVPAVEGEGLEKGGGFSGKMA